MRQKVKTEIGVEKPTKQTKATKQAIRQKPLNIGQAAAQSGVSAKMIRHYEEIGLAPRVLRSDSGYRVYQEEDIHILRFIKQARSLGFPTDKIKKLLGLWRNRSRPSRDVKSLAEAHIQELEKKIVELELMRDSLMELVDSCRGDQRPHCPILNRLARFRSSPFLDPSD